MFDKQTPPHRTGHRVSAFYNSSGEVHTTVPKATSSPELLYVPAVYVHRTRTKNQRVLLSRLHGDNGKDVKRAKHASTSAAAEIHMAAFVLF